MINKVLKTINKYNLINSKDKIVIGVSGGPDSICLLNILNELKNELDIQIYIAHINHLIRPEAEQETKYVEDFAKKIGVQCFVKRINVIEKSNNEKIGTEEAGRKARYDFFEEVLKKVGANKIATAHNANDNAETVLMNVFRGAGISGLKGIEPIRDGKYIRPIIECERFEIEKYCEEKKLEPKIDMSNYENIYTRNKIRNIIIPKIKQELNPNVIESINKLSQLAKQENDFVQNYVKNVIDNELELYQNKIDNNVLGNKETNSKKTDFEYCNSNYISINLKKFNNQETFLKSRIVLNLIENVLGSTQGIEKIHIDDIIKLCSNNIGNKYLTPNKNIKILVKSGKIYFINTKKYCQ